MGVESLDLDLDADAVLLLGDNGAGKSSVLKALRIALGAWLRGVDLKEVSAPHIAPWMMRQIVVEQGHELVLQRSDEASRVSVKGRLEGGAELEWAVARNSAKSSRTRFREARNLLDTAAKWVSGDDPHPLPLVAYFGARRARSASRRTAGKGVEPRAMAYARSLDSSLDVNRLLSRWDRLDRQSSARSSKAADARAVRDALESCLSELLPGDGQVVYDPSLEEPVMLMKGEDERAQRFAALSDGYRNVIEIGMDLALRAIQLNPALGSDSIVATQGVVLIDEVGQHLHPAWQTEVLSRLRRAFPSLQFIVTTHSPFVALHRGGGAKVYRLSGGPEGASATEVTDVGATVDMTLRGAAFGPIITSGPELLAALEERRQILSAFVGEPAVGTREKLARSSDRIEELRGVRPTRIEDVVRRLSAEASQNVAADDDSQERLMAIEVRARQALKSANQKKGG